MQLIDTSDNNRKGGSPILDWKMVAASGVAGAFLKAHENDYLSLNFADNYRAALDAGLCFVSPYTFARPDLETGAQAASILLSTIGNAGGLQAGSTLALDLEEHGGTGPQIDANAPLDAYALDWYQHAACPVGVRPYLYSRVDYILAHNLMTPDIINHFDLWLVTWDGLDHTVVTSKWPARIVQYSTTGLVGGIDGLVDQDWFGGRAYDLLNGRVFGYLPDPLNVPIGQPDISGDVPTILGHVQSLVQTVNADLALARTQFGLVT